MNAENMKDLAKVRYERAVELLAEAEEMLNDEHYKSANNRAFYSAEKAIKAALAAKGKDAESHNGVIKTFNMEFIHVPSEYFDRGDMSAFQGMERIRTASDYDDFYVTSKDECSEQVKKARNLLEKVRKYLSSEEIL